MIKFTAAYAVIYGFGEFSSDGSPRRLIGGSVLLLRQKKSKKWQLPGGDIIIPDADAATVLKKTVHDMCGLEVKPGWQLGETMENADSFIYGLHCLVCGGGLVQQDIEGEIDMARFCTFSELAQKAFTMTEGGHPRSHELKLVGPRTTRIVLDALSLKKEPIIAKPPFDRPEFAALKTRNEPLLADAPTLLGDHYFQLSEGKDGSVRCWSRLQLAIQAATAAS